ncbi:dehydrogenase [Bacillus cereus]|uniref:Dehydrogenase n=1 Tax=Bacillus cereus TaxID=1396 RepID=A0A9W7PZH2_BACCE|nr:PQQ-binding-like beta-propeller repeat protein [Bacillus cereus]KAA6449254.1 dehydrogenase [Bacillus cereus]
MKFIRKIYAVLMLSCIALTCVLSIEPQAISADVDWPIYGKDESRTRQIYDPDLKPPIKFKAKMNLGWSVSQTITVGDYFYHVAAVPDTNNLFKLPRGTYLYKIPVKFKYFSPSSSNSEVASDLIKNGARAVKLGEYVKSYSHPTWSAENQTFYVGYDTKVLALDSNLNLLGIYEVGARIVGPPTAYPGDNVLIGAANGNQKGAIHGIHGLKENRPKGRFLNLSDYENGEISGAVTRIGDNTAIFGVNHRASVRKSPLVRLNVWNLIYGGEAIEWLKIAQTGIPSNAVLEGEFIYHTDKYGGVYKVRASNGEVIWHTQIPNVTLINNSLTIDDKHIYIPVRKPGKVVAIDKNWGSTAWSAETGRDRNGNFLDSAIGYGYDVGNDMTAWTTPAGQKIVFYGDTLGQLIFLDQNGNRVNIAKDYSSGREMPFIRATYNKDIPEDWQYQGAGLATETNISKKHLVFGVNHSNNTMGELWFYSVGLTNDVLVENIKGGVFGKNQTVVTPVTVGSAATSSGARVAKVRFYVDNRLIEERSVRLDPRQKRTLYFKWTTPNAIKTGELKATINDPAEFEEVDMTNNMKKTTYRTDDSIPEGVNSCGPQENINVGLVDTREETDEDGFVYYIDYYEFLTTHITKVDPKRLRAGYGFSFEVETEYINEARNASGPKETEVFYDENVSFAGNKSVMEVGSRAFGQNRYQEYTTWKLPSIYVENYSGNVFYDPFHLKRDKNDNFVKPSGEAKWYTNFNRKDGKYPFKVVASQAGKNNLTSCITTDEVEVKGSPFNDYVNRFVDPNNPFPSGEKGYNWKDNESKILKEKNYYNDKESGDHAISSKYLDRDEIENIRKMAPKEVTKSAVFDFIRQGQ